ncbi:MAG: response regulator [Patescibacteria group bacterium]
MTQTSHTILIVEDEPSLSEALKDKFTREGFHALTARNGEEGLKIAQEKVPSVILLDIVMPKMDGVTVFKKLQESQDTANIPVIFLTNLSNAEQVAEELGAGNYQYLVKSDWDMKDVVAKVRSTIQEKHGVAWAVEE